MQSYEGYFENGQIRTPKQMAHIKGHKSVIITVLNEPITIRRDTWAELDKIIAEMDEKPRLEDFPRCKLGRELINVEEM